MTDAIIRPRLRFLRPHRQLSPPVALEAGPRRAGDGASGATPGSSGPERQRVPPSRGGPGSRGRLSHGQGPEPSGAPSGASRGPAAPPGPERARCAGVAGHRGQSALARRPLPFRPLPRRAARPTCVYSAATAMGDSARGARGPRPGEAGAAAARPGGGRARAPPQQRGAVRAESCQRSTNFPRGRPPGRRRRRLAPPGAARRALAARLAGAGAGAGATLLPGRVGEVGPPGGARALLREPAAPGARTRGREAGALRAVLARVQPPQVAARLLERAEGYDHFHRKPNRIELLELVRILF